ncbi:MAG: HAD family hydrolase [Deltaproteobacteria bacterium]|nr:MAG: HAD family hydrolase [Deltaproteobacteria bacterium]
MKKPAVFIDRDGTINEQRGYINHLSRFELLPGVTDAVKLLNKNNFFAIIVSNQSGVARGYYPLSLVHQVHELMTKSLEREGGTIDGIFYCPHHPRGIVAEFTAECDCRKPKTGLVNQALKAFDIDMSNSFVVGDRYVDIELAIRLNIKGVLVKTGYGLGEMEYVIPELPVKPNHVAEDLLDAVKWILNQERE